MGTPLHCLNLPFQPLVRSCRFREARSRELTHFSSSARFLPIVGLAIVFNVTNAIGFTYADRDAKERWASSVVGGGWGVAGVGGQILGSMVTSGIGRLIR